jgi:hypothetical protein
VSRVNLKQLINILITKMNDAKEVIRSQVEILLVELADFMSSKDVIL